jgi:Helix-turn-helix domain
MTMNSGPFPRVHWGPKKSKRKRGPARSRVAEHPQDIVLPNARGSGDALWADRRPPRENRPSWTMDPQKMMLRCVGPGPTKRFKIADLYWCQGKTAGEIAAELAISRNSVKSIINRLVNGG